VRSLAVGEDSAAVSFACQHTTTLGVLPGAHMPEAARPVGRSGSCVGAARSSNTARASPPFPAGGTLRDDIRPGFRTTGFRGRVVIAYATIGDTVVILRIYYGGRDYRTLLSEPNERPFGPPEAA